MLERYFIRPTTVDRIRAAWLGEPIERYVGWLRENSYAPRNVFVRVPLLVKFSEFAQSHGAISFDQLPDYVDVFVPGWVRGHSRWCHDEADRRRVENAARGPIVQLLRLLSIEGAERVQTRRRLPEPFTERATGFFDYLRDERGLRRATVEGYASMLRRFEQYLERIELEELSDLSATTSTLSDSTIR
jgi:integrase/recombinase XerD